ncbi:hypothetical protein [Phyllobacterium endophyticum]|uniref:hypothetical protein n=1 Tax=Phyllobacterium endophyticum TaxID=1149773 RepID=UPI00164F7A10|nr:hypothetical protein [Phyllobacterium endophyticum]
MAVDPVTSRFAAATSLEPFPRMQVAETVALVRLPRVDMLKHADHINAARAN